MNFDQFDTSQGNQPSLFAISPESIQPQAISPGSIQPQPVRPPYFPPYFGYPRPPFSPYPPRPRPPYGPEYPSYPQYPSYPPRPPYQPEYPSYPQYPSSTFGGCEQKWATVRTRDGRRLTIYVTSISEESVGGFLPDGRQIALDYDEIVEMTC